MSSIIHAVYGIVRNETGQFFFLFQCLRILSCEDKHRVPRKKEPVTGADGDGPSDRWVGKVGSHSFLLPNYSSVLAWGAVG